MPAGRIIVLDDDIKAVLASAKTIAILGLSPKPRRDSHMVARYLQSQGYRIIPVRPGQKELLGEKAYASLDDIHEPVDIIDAFRNPAQMAPHAYQALRIKPRLFWMQKGIANDQAAGILTAGGIDVIMDRCIKVEHERLCR